MGKRSRLTISGSSNPVITFHSRSIAEKNSNSGLDRQNHCYFTEETETEYQKVEQFLSS